VQQLNGALLRTDQEILVLRGQRAAVDPEVQRAREEQSSADKPSEEQGASGASPQKGPAGVRSEREIPSRLLSQFARLLAGHRRRYVKSRADATPTFLSNEAESLEKATWRQGRLEAAAGGIVSFANQRLMEHRFRKLTLAIMAWGLVIALGVGAFAVAPKFAEPRVLPVTQPTRVVVHLTGDNFGPGCPTGLVLQGAVVGGTWEEPIVVTETRGDCVGRRVTLRSDSTVAVVVPLPASSSSTPPTPTVPSPTP
jgi:hypothetical protein